MRIFMITSIFLIFIVGIIFSESIEIDFDRLNYGEYKLTYEEHYFDGIGESILTIKKLGDGYLAVWEGITDTTKVYTDINFNTQKMIIYDKDTNITAERYGNILRVTGIDKEKKINQNLTLKGEYWYQLLSFSLIKFTVSDERNIVFSLFDPYNLKVRKMKIDKKGSELITLFGEHYNSVKLSMRMKGILSPFWKSELWNNPVNGIHLKYEGINIIPSFYKAKIFLKKIEFQEVSD